MAQESHRKAQDVAEKPGKNRRGRRICRESAEDCGFQAHYLAAVGRLQQSHAGVEENSRITFGEGDVGWHSSIY